MSGKKGSPATPTTSVTVAETALLYQRIRGAQERANGLSAPWEARFLILSYAESLVHSVREASGQGPREHGLTKLSRVVAETYRKLPANQAAIVQYTLGERIPIGPNVTFAPRDLEVFASDQLFLEAGLTPAQALSLRLTGKFKLTEGEKIRVLVPGGAPVKEELLPQIKILAPELKSTLIKSSSIEVEISRELVDLFKPKEPIPGSVPTDRQILEELNRFIDEMERPTVPVIKPNGPSWRSGREEEQWQSASAECVQEIKDLVDSPLPPDETDIDPPIMLAYQLGEHDTDEQTRQIWGNIVEYSRNMNLAFARLNRWMNRGAPSVPPPQQPQGPGPITVPVTYKSSALIKAAKKLTVSTSEIAPFETAFALVTAATPELANFYKPLCGYGFADSSVRKLRRLFGHFRLGASSLSMGDLVLLRDDMMGLERWVVVVESTGSSTMNAVIHQADNTFEVSSISGTPVMAWSPTPRLVLDPASQIASFWGPGITKMLRILTHPDMRSCGEFLLEATTGTSYEKVVGAVTSHMNRFSVFMDAIRPELYRFTPQLPPHPWSFLFTGKDEEIGIYLPDGLVLGARGSTFQYFTWAQFDAQWIWYPHR